MKRATAAILAIGLIVTACGQSSSSTSSAPSTSNAPTSNAPSPSAAKEYRIGAFALVPFTQLQDMMAGFKESATACGLVEGDNTTYFLDFAQGNQATLQLLAKRDLDNHVDMFVALDTPSMVTQASQTDTVPIVAVAPTFPTTSGVVASLDGSGTNVTGGSDFVDPAVAFDTMLKVLPDITSVGMIYNPAEQNSSQFQEAARPIATAKGISLEEVSITSTGEIQAAARGLIGRVDAILLGPDNTAISAAATIAQIANDNGVPLVSYVSGVAVKGALVDMGVSYLFLGQKAGEQACEILINGADPATMPFTTITDPTLTVNTQVAETLNIQIPSDVLSGAETVTTEGS